MTHKEIGDRLVRDIKQLAEEARYLYDNVVLPHWETQSHRNWITLYGLIMSAFATIDLASQYWWGSRDNQTPRMRQFMDKYLSDDPEANDVALQMWRHSLMHTGQPRILLDERTETRYCWLLHWSPDKLSPLKHFTFEGDQPERKLNLTLLDLLRDVREAVKRYVEDLNRDSTLQEKCLAAHPLVECQPFRSRL